MTEVREIELESSEFESEEIAELQCNRMVHGMAITVIGSFALIKFYEQLSSDYNQNLRYVADLTSLALAGGIIKIIRNAAPLLWYEIKTWVNEEGPDN